MHTRRVATFLAGIWLGGSAMMAAFVLANLRSSTRVLSEASVQAAQIIKRLGAEDAALLLQYQASEEIRTYLANWEFAQFAIGLAFFACLFAGTQRKPLPLALCGVMLFLVLIQRFALQPELAFRGREADFPPGNRTFSTQARLWTIEQLYLGAEAAKLILGGVLTSYLFVFQAGERRRRRKVDPVDDPHHSHVNG